MFTFIYLIISFMEKNDRFQSTIGADPLFLDAFVEGNKDAAFSALFDLYTRHPEIVSSHIVFSSERFIELVELELGPKKMEEWTRCGKGSFRDMAFDSGLRWLLTNA
jgi:hypothetical protein